MGLGGRGAGAQRVAPSLGPLGRAGTTGAQQRALGAGPLSSRLLPALAEGSAGGPLTGLGPKRTRRAFSGGRPKAYADSQADLELARRASQRLARLSPSSGETAAFSAESGELDAAAASYAQKERAETPTRFLAATTLLDWRRGDFARAVARLRALENTPDFETRLRSSFGRKPGFGPGAPGRRGRLHPPGRRAGGDLAAWQA